MRCSSCRAYSKKGLLFPSARKRAYSSSAPRTSRARAGGEARLRAIIDAFDAKHPIVEEPSE